MSDKKEHTELPDLNRYEPCCNESEGSMRLDIEGEFVEYDDVAVIHSRLVQENEELKETILDLQNNAEVREELLEEMRNALGMLENKVSEGMLTLKEEKLLEKLRIQ